MKQRQRLIQTTTAVLLGCGLLVAPSVAQLGEANGSGVQMSTEVIGTLPTFWVEDEIGLTHMPNPEHTPMLHDLHVETFVPCEDTQLLTELKELVTHADGNGFVVLSAPEAFDGVVRARFYGDVSVRMDRTMVTDLGLPMRLEFGGGNAGGLGLIEVDSVAAAPFQLDALGSGLPVPIGGNPIFDAIFEQSDVRFYSVAETPDVPGSGFDVGTMDISVGTDFYGFDLSVVESYLP